MKKRLIAGLLISLVFLYYAFRDVSWDDFFTSLLGINYLWFIPGVISIVASFAIRAVRWNMLVAPLQKVTFNETFSATMIGYMGNNVLPFRLGDLVRAYAFSKSTGIKKSATFASLLLERILDLLTTLIALGIVLVYFPNFPPWVSKVGYASVTIIIILVLFTVFMQFKSKMVVDIFNFVLRPIPTKWSYTVEKKIKSFSEGLQVVSQYKKYFGLLVISVLHWPIYLSTILFTFRAFGYSFGLIEAFVVLVFITFAVAIPSAPGYVGTFHGLVVASMALFGLGGDQARAFSVVLHASNYIPVTLIGLYFFWKQQITLKEVETEVEEIPDTGDISDLAKEE